MAGTGFLEALGISLVVAACVVLIGRTLNMPSIVSYLLAGLLVGPVTGLVTPAHHEHGALELLSELGIVLLMFLVGIELSLDRVRQVGGVAVAAGLGQVVFTAAGGTGLCLLLGFDRITSLYVATALTFSSTVVVVKLLDQKGHLHALYGRIAVGIFLVQDMVVVVMLTLLAGLGASEGLDPTSVGLELARAFGGMAALLVVCLLAARWLLPTPFRWAARSPRTLFVWSMAWCLAFVSVAAAFGLSAEIGAFLAGLAVAQLDAASDLRRRVHPLMSFFIAVFFVTLGARMELGAALEWWREAAALSLFVLVGNPLIFMLIIARYGYSERTCFDTSVTVAQISEFSFIFASMGVAAGLIGAEVLSVVAVVGLVTITASAYMILYSDRLYAVVSRAGLLRVFRARQEPDEEPPADRLRDHVVVVGMNDLGRSAVRALHEAGERVLAVDVDPHKLADLPSARLVGSVEYESTLVDAGVPEARAVVCALRIEATAKLLTYHCRRWGVPVVVYGFDRSVADELRRLGPDHVVAAKEEAARRMVEVAIRAAEATP